MNQLDITLHTERVVVHSERGIGHRRVVHEITRVHERNEAAMNAALRRRTNISWREIVRREVAHSESKP